MLTTVLHDIRCAADTVRLFAALGYTPLDQPFDDDARLVARWRGFKVVAADAADPRQRARALARCLAAGGQRAMAVAVGPTGELVLAAARPTPGGRLLTIPAQQPSRDVVQLLERLRPEGTATALAHTFRVAELLSTETAGERFFTAFRVILERMAASLDHRHSVADRRMLALLALIRVLFLYFVQAKGWLDGRPDYLRRLLDDALARRRPFHRSVLDPLFFGTLNRPLDRRPRRPVPGELPYLNGGLFEPHAVERRVRHTGFPNPLWRDAFDSLFERFRFCVREADDVDAVAPDMLGRVFERLMDGEERGDTGTYYTPESVVRQIVDAAIETGLAGTGALDPDTARRLVAGEPIPQTHTSAARAAARALRVLDPAVGSGAFLLGALHSLTDIRLALGDGGAPENRWRLRRAILRENLFGVDLNPFAVRLAELRLWLAVVADDPTAAIAAVAPLPNLNGVVRQGDTLFDPLGAARSAQRFGWPPGLSAALTGVRRARRALFDARGPERDRAVRTLHAAELRLARPILAHALTHTEHAMRELATARGNRDLFGSPTPLHATQRHRERILAHQHGALRRALQSLEDGALPFFSFEVHTPEVLAAGGFSVVMGNPPWVRAERLPSATRQALAERFRWWRSAPGRGFAHLPDLAVAFLERALELVAPGGAVALLLPSKVGTAGYGETARRHLIKETTLTYLHRVPEHDAARFGATTYPLAVVLRKQPPAPTHAVHLSFGRDTQLAQRSLAAAGPWMLVPEPTRDALAELMAAGRPLAEVAPVALGVKTGADSVFLGLPIRAAGDRVVVRFGDEEVTIERALLRPALRGRDVRPFAAHARHAILWTHDSSGAPLRALPPRARAYLELRIEALRDRADYRDGPPWTLFRTKAATLPHRVVWPDIARRPRAVALDETAVADAVPLNTCYVAAAPDRETALGATAVLNSVWAAALVAVSADEARGGYRRINARVIGQIPLPQSPQRRAALAAVSAAAHKDPHARATDLDDAVADAFGLSPRARDALRRLAAHHLSRPHPG